MAADVLNALGYSSVEPMAPRGGSDGGRDIRFKEGDTPGLAFVTLDKKIRDKFKRDLLKQHDSQGVIALFCNVDVSPSQKLDFAKDAIGKGYRLEVFDLERLRSLLDSSLKDLRRRYLGIDDEVAGRLRSEITKLLRFPDAIADRLGAPTVVEGLLINQLPRRLFEVLLTYEERDVAGPRYRPGLAGFLQKLLQLSAEGPEALRNGYICELGKWSQYVLQPVGASISSTSSCDSLARHKKKLLDGATF